VKFLGTKVPSTLGDLRWPFQSVCILYCGCFNLLCNMWVLVYVGVFDNCAGVLVNCVLVFTVFYIACIVSPFMYIYSYLFCLYWCKDCCHRMTTELQ
jgi:hypothetical protein